MLAGFLRRLLVALMAFGLFAGTGYAAPDSAMQSVPMEMCAQSTCCGQMAAMAAPGFHSSSQGEPCKAIASGCIDQMMCMQASNLPDPHEYAYRQVTYERLAFWSGTHILSGRDLKPDLFPPIAG